MGTSAVFEFHISRAARDRYNFDQVLFSFNGNVVFANVLAARQFANRINTVRGTTNDPVRAARPADLNAMGLIDEVLHALVALYRRKRDPSAMTGALAWFGSRLGQQSVDSALLKFVEQFPPAAVYQGQTTPEQWLAGETNGLSHRAVALEELMMLWLANANPAFTPFSELFDESLLGSTAYRQIASGLREYFDTRPKFGRKNQNLVDVLRAPALMSPNSLTGQLAFLKEEFSDELGDLLQQILTAIDVLKEEELAMWTLFHPPGEHRHFGGALTTGDSSSAAVPQFSGKEPEYERFSPDVDWMPSTVLLAKSVYVWLDQLSKTYRRSIRQLDQVPDEELNIMARRGFNALWLIGVWERSTASKRIKQLTGNPEAAASAYSLADYTVASDLGGESSYKNLRDRAQLRGIRLASDMVPNHMGIDSRWVFEHPDWFLSLPYSPYPAYSFNGPDLSSDSRVEIKIEDHYYDRTDAAVVFRRVDRWSGDTRYVYHGNDGTSFPWNDTAQLNYLNPEVREAVIQTIIHVARLFPIIRFDAAMTLTKQHYQRLWFPAPGTGSAIPSRAEHGLTKPAFDAAMPHEFWREVVDRIAVEVPGTLLLAEAFWLLEGYFVRTLGMHRVYNSAFMNMMRDEENANYRSVLKNTLEFDPDVLKRYVSFMNNPDERTAVDQFGKGDKYFGVCTLLATLPGLPMFGHGQFEGFGERYGMEYRRAYHDEQPDTWLIGRHEREISPLLHRRPLFAEVKNFLLYDFFTDGGTVNEDVFAYSNRLENDRALVIYHNRYATTHGWVRMSCSYAEKAADGSKRVRQRSLGESFGLQNDPISFIAYRDALSGLEYLHRSGDILDKGIRLDLNAYQCHVLLDWRDLREDATHPWSALCDSLGGRGVPSLDDALRELELKPVHDAWLHIFEPKVIEVLVSSSGQEQAGGKAAPKESVAETKISSRRARKVAGGEESGGDHDQAALPESIAELENRGRAFISQVSRFAIRETEQHPHTELKSSVPWNCEDAFSALHTHLQAIFRLPSLEQSFARPWPPEALTVMPGSEGKGTAPAWAGVIGWAILDAIASVASPSDPEHYAVALFDTARLRQAAAEAFERLGLQGEDRWKAAARLRFAFAHSAPPRTTTTAADRSLTPLSWIHDPEVAWLIGVHDHEGVRYFNKEEFEKLLWSMALRRLFEIAKTGSIDIPRIRALEREIEVHSRSAEKAGYRIESLLEPTV